MHRVQALEQFITLSQLYNLSLPKVFGVQELHIYFASLSISQVILLGYTKLCSPA